jgi:hypothetical protein
MRLPDTVSGIMSLLDETFPESVPQPGDSPDKIFHAAGQRSVVLFLKNLRDGLLREPPAQRPRGQGRPVR